MGRKLFPKPPFKASLKKKLSESRSNATAQGSGDAVEGGEEVTSPETAACPNPAPHAPITEDAKEQGPRKRLGGSNAAAFYGATRRNLNDDFVASEPDFI